MSTTKSRIDLDILTLLSKGMEEATNADKTQAYTCFKQVLRLDPKNETAMLWMAWITNDTLEAIELLERVLALNPRNNVARAYLRQAKARRGDAVMFSTGSASLNAWKSAGSSTRQQDRGVTPFLGEFLLRKGYITYDQLRTALNQHKQMAQKGVSKPIGQTLVELGYLTSAQLEAGLQMYASY